MHGLPEHQPSSPSGAKPVMWKRIWFARKWTRRRKNLAQRSVSTQRCKCVLLLYLSRVHCTSVELYHDKFRGNFYAFISLIIEEIRILGDSTPLMAASMCIRVQGLLDSDASSSRSFIYEEVCQKVYLFSLNTWRESIVSRIFFSRVVYSSTKSVRSIVLTGFSRSLK